MKTNARLIIFALVILAVGAIFVIPYLDPAGKAPTLTEGSEGKAPDKFTLTERPAEKLEKALQDGRPVFLEFYAYT